MYNYTNILLLVSYVYTKNRMLTRILLFSLLRPNRSFLYLYINRYVVNVPLHICCITQVLYKYYTSIIYTSIIQVLYTQVLYKYYIHKYYTSIIYTSIIKVLYTQVLYKYYIHKYYIHKYYTSIMYIFYINLKINLYQETKKIATKWSFLHLYINQYVVHTPLHICSQ
jgi:hypothetical protein